MRRAEAGRPAARHDPGVASIGPEKFKNHLEAHLRYAGMLGDERGVEILRQRLEDASWSEQPEVWLNTAWRLSHVVPLEQTCAELARVVRDRPEHKPGLVAVLPNIIRICLDAGDRASVDSLASTFISVAEPGDAGILLDLAAAPGPELLPRRIIDWLIRDGSGELRSRDRAGAVALMAIHLAPGDADDRGRAASLLRLVVDGENPSGAWWHGYSTVEPRPKDPSLWAAVEVGLGRGLEPDDVEILLDVDASVQSGIGVAQLLAPLTSGAYPRARDALMRAMTNGRLPEALRRPAWEAVMRGMPPAGLAIANVEALIPGLEVLLYAADKSNVELGAWCETLVGAVFERCGLHASPTGVRSHCSPYALACWSELQAPVRAALEQHLDRDEPGVRFAAEILDRHPEAEAVLPALLVLPSPVATPVRDVADFREMVEHQLTALVRRRWPAVRHLDVGALRGSARCVEVRELSDGDQVRIEKDRILLSGGYVEDIAKGERDVERAIRLCTLYFLHELIHVAQGIRRKASVTTLRAAGSETTLKHLDLEADHLAALLTARLRPTWDLVGLKDLQVRSLQAFPVGRFHTTASRARKVGRFVSLRVDFLLRARRLVEPTTEDYFFVEHAPQGGTFTVMRSGAVTSLLGATEVARPQIDRLREAVRLGDLEALDGVLGPVLAAIATATREEPLPVHR